MNQQEFIFAGFGGQGVMFVGQLLAYAAMDEGLHVTWIPSYGPEMRGGTAHCIVVISPKPIGSPVVSNLKVAVAFNNPSFDKYEPLVVSGGLFAYNSSIITCTSKRTDIDILGVPASELADQLGNLKLMNMVMLGAILTVQPVLSLEAIKHALEHHIPAHRRDMLDLNYRAVDSGAMYIKKTLALA
jgi:2-oxoglutarate ferredoxin oxidoreductase subunit gamma